MGPRKVSVIVVNYGTASLSIDAVNSALNAPDEGREVTVHLVDNASPGEDAQMLQQAAIDNSWGNRVVLYCEDENHGFGRGNNVVLTALADQAVPPDYVLFLNPDARLKNNAIDLLAGFLDSPSKGGRGRCTDRKA